VRAGILARGARLEATRQSRPALRAARGGRRAAGRSEQGDTRARLDADDELRRSGAHDGGRGPGAAVVKVLVTGADGFVGRWVVRRLLGDGREVYGASHESRPRRETDAVAPCSPYAASKAGGELAGLEAWRRTGLRVIVTRAFAHTGPGQDTRFVVPAFAERLRFAKRVQAPVVKVGNLEPVREFLHVRDVVDAYARLLVKGQPGETYNVASGQAVSLEELFFRLTDLIGARPIPEADPELVRGGDIFHLVGDAAKLRAATGWVPRYTLDDTLRDVLDAQAD